MYSNTVQLKLRAKDGKYRETDTLDTKGIFRLIESVPSPKAEPFIILDSEKIFYIKGLKEYENDQAFLIDTIKNEQDIFRKICEELLGFNQKD